ncbi:hypothetical protein GJ496_007139 [Pomphorhynchus laevis]|nr:hypothetical protein GJ496_007139 [Pomphorhynchus laevis]
MTAFSKLIKLTTMTLIFRRLMLSFYDPKPNDEYEEFNNPAFSQNRSERNYKCHCSTVRYKLAYLSSLGFLISFGIRCNMGVAILAMIDNNTIKISYENQTIIVEPEFHWSPETISVLDSSYFWGYLITQLPGGYLSAKFEAHRIFGYAFMASSMLNCVIPIAVKINVLAAMFVRILQGLFEGVTYPACHGIWRYWAPASERSRLATISFTGSYAGAVFGIPLSGILTERISWQLPFYVYGVLGIGWAYIWFRYAAERPATCPYITAKERMYIENNVGQSSSLAQKLWLKPPWTKILKSLPVWAIMVANFCRSFSFYLLIIAQAFYFKEALGFRVGSHGFLAALPHIAMTCVVPVAGQIADYLRSHYFSTTVVRKIMNCGGFGMEAIFLLIVAYAKTPAVAITALTLAVGFSGFAIAGFNVNHLDIAPRYASILMGLSNGFGTIAGLLCPLFSQLMTKNGTKQEWAHVFLVASSLHFFGIIFYWIFASGEKQNWADSTGEEIIPLM